MDYNPLDYCLQHDQSAEWKTFAEFWRAMSGLADSSCIFLRKSSQPKQILTAPISRASSGKREIQPLRSSPRSRRFLEPRRQRCLAINQRQQNDSLAGHNSRPRIASRQHTNAANAGIGGQASRLGGRPRWLFRQLLNLRADDGNEQSGIAKSPRGEHGPVNRGH